MYQTVGIPWVVAALLLCLPATGWAQTLPVIGWLEVVHINRANLDFEAKIDTGADTTSIGAEILREYQIRGHDWVRYRLDNKRGQRVILESKVVRHVRIKRRLAPSIRRPVVKLGVCLGGVFRKVEVNLASRTKYKFRMLIGRNFLRSAYMVDASQEFTTPPRCPKPARRHEAR